MTTFEDFVQERVLAGDQVTLMRLNTALTTTAAGRRCGIGLPTHEFEIHVQDLGRPGL